jgi:hypothetical protein
MNAGHINGTYVHLAPWDPRTERNTVFYPSHLHCAQRTRPLHSSGQRARSSDPLLADDTLSLIAERRRLRLPFGFDTSIPDAHRNRGFLTPVHLAEATKMWSGCYRLAVGREQLDTLDARAILSGPDRVKTGCRASGTPVERATRRGMLRAKG